MPCRIYPNDKKMYQISPLYVSFTCQMFWAKSMLLIFSQGCCWRIVCADCPVGNHKQSHSYKSKFSTNTNAKDCWQQLNYISLKYCVLLYTYMQATTGICLWHNSGLEFWIIYFQWEHLFLILIEVSHKLIIYIRLAMA